MSSSSAFRSLDAVAAHLPFHLDETAKVNAAFTRWRQEGGGEDKRIVDLWTYCYIQRYFIIKFMRESDYSAADHDLLVEKVYQKVDQNRSGIVDANRYASWVSVVCRNTFLNFRRSRRKMVPLDGVEPASEEPPAFQDLGSLLLVLLAAIDRLPMFLREIVRLRLVQELSYEEIGAITGKPLPIIRSYINKAMKRFREDPQLLVYLDREKAGKSAHD